MPLVLTPATSATDVAIHKKVWIWFASFGISKESSIDNF